VTKKILPVVLMCCLISSCGSHELPLKYGGAAATTPGAMPEVPAENPQKADAPFLSLNKTGTAILAVSVILVISALAWKLRKADKEIAAFKASSNPEKIEDLEMRLSKKTKQEQSLQIDKEKLTSELTKEQEKTRTLQTALEEKNRQIKELQKRPTPQQLSEKETRIRELKRVLQRQPTEEELKELRMRLKPTDIEKELKQVKNELMEKNTQIAKLEEKLQGKPTDKILQELRGRPTDEQVREVITTLEQARNVFKEKEIQIINLKRILREKLAKELAEAQERLDKAKKDLTAEQKKTADLT